MREYYEKRETRKSYQYSFLQIFGFLHLEQGWHQYLTYYSIQHSPKKKKKKKKIRKEKKR